MDSWKNKQKVIVQLVCILLSLCLWIYVTNIKNPIKSYELKNVPVEILNSNSLQDSGLALVPNQNFYVNLKIEGNTLTTKGDSNNSDDVRIDKSKVIGKVILRIPKGGVLREVFTTPKVIVSIVVTLILISLSISYIPKDKRKKVVSLDDKFEDPDCIYKK